MAAILPINLNGCLQLLRGCPFHSRDFSKSLFRTLSQMVLHRGFSTSSLSSNHIMVCRITAISALNTKMPMAVQAPHKTQSRFKSRSHKGRKADDSVESDYSDEEIETSKDFQVIKGDVKTTRIDAVLKFAFGMSRNKVDNAFYASKIYINGEKLMKKSDLLTVEDEVDVVRQQNGLNPAFLDISRVEVLDVRRSSSDEQKLVLKVKRFKRLTVANYAQPWKPVEEE